MHISKSLIQVIAICLLLSSCSIVNNDKDTENSGVIIGKIGKFNELKGQTKRIIKVYLKTKEDEYQIIDFSNSNTFSFKNLLPGKYDIVMELYFTLDNKEVCIIKGLEIYADKISYVVFPWYVEGISPLLNTPGSATSYLDTLRGKNGDVINFLIHEWQWDKKYINKDYVLKKGSMEGVIKDKDQQKAAKWTDITIINGNDNQLPTIEYKTKTDQGGKFLISNIQCGLYDLIVATDEGEGVNNILILPDSIAIVDDYTNDAGSWIMHYKK